MGLFKKKKEVEIPSKLSDTEIADFEKTLVETPPVPEPKKAEIRPIPHKEEEPMSKPTAPPKISPLPETKGKELPAFELSSKPALTPEEPHVEIEKGFELPDFDEAALKELEETKAFKEEVEKKPEPVKPITPPKPVKPVKPLRLVGRLKKNFIDINGYLIIKEDLDRINILAENTEKRIDQHMVMGRAKDKKYKILAANLNVIQDKLMFIDNKLFESHQDLEVNL